MERRDIIYIAGSCLTALLVVLPAAILHGILGGFDYAVYLGLPAGFAFSWFVWRERESSRLIHALSALAILLVAVWMGWAVFNSTLGYKEVVLICLKGVFLIAVVYSFFCPSFSSLVAVQYLSLPAFLGQALFSSISGTRLTVVIAAYLLVWLAVIRLKLVSLTDGRGRHPFAGPASITLLAVFFSACLFSAGYLSVRFTGQKLKYSGLLLEEDKRDDFGTAEEDYYGKLERFQKEALKRIPDLEKKEDRQRAMTYLATLVKEAADTLATAKAEEGLISVFRNPGGGLDSQADLRHITIQMRETVKSKIVFQQKKGKKDFLDRVKRNPLDFSQRLSMVNGVNRLGSHGASRSEIEQKERVLKDKVDSTQLPDKEKAGLKQAAERMSEWDTFQLYREKLDKLRKQLAKKKSGDGKGRGNDVQDGGEGYSKRPGREQRGGWGLDERKEREGKGGRKDEPGDERGGGPGNDREGDEGVSPAGERPGEGYDEVDDLLDEGFDGESGTDRDGAREGSRSGDEGYGEDGPEKGVPGSQGKEPGEGEGLMSGSKRTGSGQDAKRDGRKGEQSEHDGEEAVAAKIRRLLAKIRAAGELPEMKETSWEIRNFQATLKNRESLAELRQLESEIRKLARDQRELAGQLEELLKIKVDMLVHQLAGELKGLAQQDQTMMSFQKERLVKGASEMRDAGDSGEIREAVKKIDANLNADDPHQKRTAGELQAAKIFQRELETVEGITHAIERQEERVGEQGDGFLRRVDQALKRRDLGQRFEELKQLENQVEAFRQDGLIDSGTENELKEGLKELGALANIEKDTNRQDESRGQDKDKSRKKNDLRAMLEEIGFEQKVHEELEKFIGQEEQARSVPQIEEVSASWNAQAHQLKSMTDRKKEFEQFQKEFEEKLQTKRALLLEQQMAALREKLVQLEQLDPEKAEELERMLARIAQSSSLEQMKREMEKLKQEVEQSLMKLARDREEKQRQEQKQQKQEKQTNSERLKETSRQLEQMEQELKRQEERIRDLEKQLLQNSQDREKIIEQLKEASQRKNELEKQLEQLNQQKENLEKSLRMEQLLKSEERREIEESLKKNEEQKKQTDEKLQSESMRKQELTQQLVRLEQQQQMLEQQLKERTADRKEIERQMQALAEQQKKLQTQLDSYSPEEQEKADETGGSSREKLYILPYRLVAPLGSGVRLTAVAVVDEFYIKDITEDSEWVSDDPMVARVDHNGMVYCASPGVTKVHLIYKGSRRRAIDVAVGAPEDPYMKGIKGMMK